MDKFIYLSKEKEPVAPKRQFTTAEEVMAELKRQWKIVHSRKK